MPSKTLTLELTSDIIMIGKWYSNKYGQVWHTKQNLSGSI